MQVWMNNPKQGVIDAKAALLAQIPDCAGRMARLDEWLADEVAAVKTEGLDAVPQIAFQDLWLDAISAAQKDRIRRRGCVVIRGVFTRQQAMEWNDAIGRYIDPMTRAMLPANVRGAEKARSERKKLRAKRPKKTGKPKDAGVATTRTGEAVDNCCASMRYSRY